MTASELLQACCQAMTNWREAGYPDEANKRNLAEILGISERSLTDWQKDGMPVLHSAGRGGSNRYSVGEAIEWMLARAAEASRESAKDRLDRLRGDQLERDMLKEDDVLVMPEDLDVEYAAMVEAARAEMLFNMPDALAAELTAIMGDEIDVSIIRRHVEAALTTLSHYDPSDDIEPGEPSGAEDASALEEEREALDS
ncbi:terminase small subunit [Halomonas caseinilytica]|uniref:Phage DNA packaging protein Nu1 n=1 Tax=Halomonas caseinilytica TaxID=438744 RepID=A0A1M7B5Q8_9GAMM|nr:terminase small subunit [Halomonas caseinilytica]SHL50291.1 Phage DNA packaging protein Nu1 [Halomonas caseinilytica]